MLGRGGGLHGDEWTTTTLPARSVAEGVDLSVVHNILGAAFLLLCDPDHVNLLIVATFTLQRFQCKRHVRPWRLRATYLALVLCLRSCFLAFS